MAEPTHVALVRSSSDRVAEGIATHIRRRSVDAPHASSGAARSYVRFGEIVEIGEFPKLQGAVSCLSVLATREEALRGRQQTAAAGHSVVEPQRERADDRVGSQ